MKTLYVLTEALFHTAYLVDKISKNKEFDNIVFLVRDNNKLDKEALTSLHKKYEGNSDLSIEHINEFDKAYGGLSLSEIDMIKRFGVPSTSAIGMDNCIVLTSFNSDTIKQMVSADKTFKCAAIFLDCILDDWWIDCFEQRIVNAHSAVLPHARGMFAIEQYLICASPADLEEAAGATIHYVNSGIDKGNIIRTKKLENIWELESVWSIKADSYMTAFSLIEEYTSQRDCFSLSDSTPQTHFGPLFLEKNFTKEKRILAQEMFSEMRESLGVCNGAA
ncbi:formyltransferase family protein [Pseudoalteromonas luteoviolacea]|uniref:Formyl transferase N-terminal domain-containing protein n=1 Tax=Pseudoalteromonas luteoviolacea NCIMB 1942 TaxID=1365253 RepID=A0A167C927_9GAMM|nr:formyltransferase family protein [Pseudoalteromonas luteoviolacea]KZN47387.1 hypothetical protein N482_09515 [Pseudoalteromonas luteoviolacea NCIMB 1942]KZW98813.1 hypothetical protein JL49_21175 [Pseudoalteromonas luteoviolacea]